MLDTLKIYNELKEQFEPEAALKLAELLGMVYRELADTVTRKEFNALTEAVQELAEAQKRTEARVEELAEAQKRTEQRLDSLTVKVEELAEAQKRTEARVEELAEAQKRTEQRLDSLTVKVEELAEAQKRTEARVEELAEAQKRTEQRLDSLTVKVEELAQAQKVTEQKVAELAEQQKNTEKQLQRLIKRVDNIEIQLGGISNTIGYSLEDRAFKPLKKLLETEFGITVDRLYRRNIVYSPDKFDEVNIYGEGQRDGKEIVVIGESKAQFGPNDVKKFLQQLKRLKAHLNREIFPLALAYHYHPKAEQLLEKNHIRYYWSHDLE